MTAPRGIDQKMIATARGACKAACGAHSWNDCGAVNCCTANFNLSCLHHGGIRFLQYRSLQHSGGALPGDAARAKRRRDRRRALDAVLAILPVVLGKDSQAALGAKRRRLSAL